MIILTSHHFPYLPFTPFSSLSLSSPTTPSRNKRSRIRVSLSSSSPMNPSIKHPEFIEFLHLSTSHRDLMVDLVTLMETRLSTHLLPSTLPPDVQFFQNETGTSQGSLNIRSGDKSSKSAIDFILGSWIHCNLPSGSLNISSLSAYLNSSTDAPNFLIELVRSSPTSLILILDLPPRKDLALNPDYLDEFYGDTQLDARRKELEKVPEVRPYFSSSLYIRCVCSPTAILVRIETSETGGEGRLEEIIREELGVIAKEVLGIWLDRCALGEGEREVEREGLEKRDRMVKRKTIEIDLGANLPRLFGPDVGSRVAGEIQKIFNSHG